MSNTTTLRSGTVISTGAGQIELAETRVQQIALQIEQARAIGAQYAVEHHQRRLIAAIEYVDALHVAAANERGF